MESAFLSTWQGHPHHAVLHQTRLGGCTVRRHTTGVANLVNRASIAMSKWWVWPCVPEILYFLTASDCVFLMQIQLRLLLPKVIRQVAQDTWGCRRLHLGLGNILRIRLLLCRVLKTRDEGSAAKPCAESTYTWMPDAEVCVYNPGLASRGGSQPAVTA